MESKNEDRIRTWIGRVLSILIAGGATAAGLMAVHSSELNPRTDDTEILANFIGIAPQVEGPVVRLNVHDNQFIKKGDLLFEVDDRPYRYALERAISEQSALEGQISDERRKIAAQTSSISVSEAVIHSTEADVNRRTAAVEQAKADVEAAGQGVARAQAEWTYASNNLHRLEPLLAKQYVTADQVDRARTSEVAQAKLLEQAKSQRKQAEAALDSAMAQEQGARAVVTQSRADYERARNAVTTLEPLVNQRGGRSSAIETARYNLNNCRVYAPFDARVTNLTISEGAYAHTGQQMFTLIDARTWWAVANFREGQLHRIEPGMKADVYLMSRPDQRFSGVVESVGFGVTPDVDVVGRLDSGLPDVQRTLNWVHLASRYPVRVRVKDPSPDFRISESAVVVVRGGKR